MRRTLVKIRKSDHLRTLLTDTLPYEVPLLFSNLGIYRYLQKNVKATFRTVHGLDILEQPAKSKWTIPYNYHIRKNPFEYRALSVMHPAQQIAVAEFYERYDTIMLALCRKSHWSLRAPIAVASHYVEHFRAKRRAATKSERVETLGTGFDSMPKTASSYFTYSRYSFLYRFIESTEYHALERKFGLLLKLDISQCFPRIYTHTISWAVTSKSFTKANLIGVKNRFEVDFDQLMQHANYNETAGILVGPEISRIFAEIILQRIDLDIESALSAGPGALVSGVDYEVRRYVDDYFVFANKRDVLNRVQETISGQLAPYRLSLNLAKSICLERPYSTSETAARIEAAAVLTAHFERFIRVSAAPDPRHALNANESTLTLAQPILAAGASTTTSLPLLNATPASEPTIKPVTVGPVVGASGPSTGFLGSTIGSATPSATHRLYEPVAIFRSEQVANFAIRDIKRTLKANNATFDTCSNFFLSRAKRLITLYMKRLPLQDRGDEHSDRILDFLSVFLQILFFFYSSSPRVRQTYVVSEILILIRNYVRDAPNRIREQITATIAREVSGIAMLSSQQEHEDNVEILNLLIVLRSFGKHFLLDTTQLQGIFGLSLTGRELNPTPKNFGYFQITTLIYYINGDARYAELSSALVEYIHGIYRDDPEWQRKSERVMLFLDFLRCPYIETGAKQELAKICLNHKGAVNLNARATSLREYVQRFEWFFEWSGDLNLGDVLLRKELRSPY